MLSVVEAIQEAYRAYRGNHKGGNMRQIPGIRDQIQSQSDRVAELLRGAANNTGQPNFQDIIQSTITSSGYKYGAPTGEKRINYMDALNDATDRRTKQTETQIGNEADLLKLLQKQKDEGDEESKTMYENILKLVGNDPQEAGRLAKALHDSPEEINSSNFYTKGLLIANEIGIKNLDLEAKRAQTALLADYNNERLKKIKNENLSGIGGVPPKEVRQQQERLSKQLETSGITEIAAPLQKLSAALDEETGDIPGIGVFDQMVPGKFLSDKGLNIRQQVSNLKNVILKARSGGAVTPQEAERFIAELGDSTEQGLRNAVVNITDTLANKLSNFEAGVSEDAVNAFEQRGGLTSRRLRNKPANVGNQALNETQKLAKEVNMPQNTINSLSTAESIPDGGSINAPQMTKNIGGKSYVKINGEWFEQ